MLDQESLHIVQAQESAAFISFITLRIYFRKRALRRAPNTITCVKQFQTELQKIRKQGYSISDNENEHGLYGIAAPIRSYTGRTIAALNIVGPISYMQGSNREIIIQSVMNTANLISKEFGYLEI